jgi:hypothetical protein
LHRDAEALVKRTEPSSGKGLADAINKSIEFTSFARANICIALSAVLVAFLTSESRQRCDAEQRLHAAHLWKKPVAPGTS